MTEFNFYQASIQKSETLFIKSLQKKLILDTPKIMGILNVTPDSFSDGGKYTQVNRALDHAASMITYGATIVDIGGESTRPGADEVSTDEELHRVIPVIEAIRARFDIWISIDTSKPEVITEAAKSGANLINDIRGLALSGAKEAAAKTNLPICIMHAQGEPKTMQDSPHYDNVVIDVINYFQQKIVDCEKVGIDKSRLILDPGFGFGKNATHNYQLLAELSKLNQFGLPLLVGLSRKSMIGYALARNYNLVSDSVEPNKLPIPHERIIGSTSATVIAAMQGANILRVHDVKETAEALSIYIETARALFS